MNSLPPALLLFFALTLHALSSETVDLKNTAGKSIRAELISLDQVTNTIRYKRLRDGRIFTSPVSLFDTTTQDRLKAFQSVENPTTMVAVSSSQKLVYDHEKDVWKEATPGGTTRRSNDVYRSIFNLKNTSSEDLKNLKVDIVVAIRSKTGQAPGRFERQTFSIMRLPAAGALQVQSKRYDIRTTGDEESQIELVSGTALRLRNAESGETITQWESDSLNGTAISWEESAQASMGLTALLN